MTMPISELVQQDLYKHAFHALFEAMRRHGFTRLVYRFEGSGDSGNLEPSVDEYDGLHDDKVEPSAIVFDEPVKIKEPSGRTMDGRGNWVQMYDDVTAVNLNELGYRMALIVLNNDPHDWYNNDGGYGNIVFEVTKEGNNKIECDMNVRIVSSEAYPDEAEFAHG